MTRVVTLLAHPDDAEILAGGTLYKHGQRGDSVEICSLTYTSDSLRGQEGVKGHAASASIFGALAWPIWECRATRQTDVERLAAYLLGTTTGHCADALAGRYTPGPYCQYAARSRGAGALCGVAWSGRCGRHRRAFPQVWSCDTYGALGRVMVILRPNGTLM